MRIFYTSMVLLLMLGGCNSVYFKPHSLDTTQTFYARRGGYSMRRSVKEQMNERGYRVIVGKATNTTEFDDNSTGIELETDTVPKQAKYIVHVREREEKLRPVWCMFNGFWWWNFSISIADQQTGAELLTWRGRGCANSSLRLLDRILDEMEK